MRSVSLQIQCIPLFVARMSYIDSTHSRRVSAIYDDGPVPVLLRRVTVTVEVDRFAQCRPRQQGALDPSGVLLHPLQGIELVFELDRRRLAVGHPLGETLHGFFGVVQPLTLDGLGHHRCRSLADRTTSTCEGDLANELTVVIDP